ncbi:MAG: ImmA/IrrE family metallo-endopeptidase [Defluviitaleaceae bacterium]|nr:ImmA/IrrE family metallo-endopeptidase [Defluviitaleaceae bacterium]
MTKKEINDFIDNILSLNLFLEKQLNLEKQLYSAIKPLHLSYLIEATNERLKTLGKSPLTLVLLKNRYSNYGCIMNVDGRAVLSYSPQTNHNLTHIVIAHEIGHLLLHLPRNGSMSSNKRLSEQEEHEADYFAEQVLFKKYALYSKHFDEAELKEKNVLCLDQIVSEITNQHPSYDSQKMS